ncbi:MAG: hypothetical protein NTU98_04135 [Bacteroidetes bacterium]|nr:hypothetical protein [Bacteroidota bacterium]
MKHVKDYYEILFILILIFTGQSNIAQNVFQIEYAGMNASIGYSIAADSVGLTIAGTASYSGQGEDDVLLMRTDLSGNILWAKTIGGKGEEIPRSIKKTSDGGYIIVGSTSSYLFASSDSSNVYVIKTNGSGNVQWTRVIGLNRKEVANDVIETYDHKYAIAGYTNSIGAGNEDVYFLELDNSGNLQWAAAIGGSGRDFGNSLVQTATHDFIIVGSTTGYGAGGQIPFMIFASESGVVQNPSLTFNLNTTVTTNKRYFTKIIDGYFNDFVITGSDGTDWIGAAQHFILDIGQTGSINWMKKYYLNSGEGVGTSLDKTRDGGFIIGGTMGFDHLALIKTDGIGQLENTKFYPDINTPYNGKGLDVKHVFDGTFALVGYHYNSSNISVYLVKADFNLSSGCNEQDGFINTEENMNPGADIQTASYTVNSPYVAIDSGIVEGADPFMNVMCITTNVSHDPPVNKSLEIKQSDHSVEFVLPDPDDFIVSAEIYNLPGAEVRSFGKGIQMISTAGLSKGIYFYRVLTNKQVLYSGKFTL